MKSLYRVPTPITTSASRASAFATGVPVEPTPPTASGWSHGTAPLPAWVSETGIPVVSAKRRSASLASAYSTPPPATMSGRCRGPDDVGGPRDSHRLWFRAGHVPHSPGEQLLGPVERFGLHVLWHSDSHGAGLGRIGENAHRGEQCGRQLFGPVDPIEESGDRPESVIDRHVVRAGVLQLLQHRCRSPGSRRCRWAGAAPGCG